MVPWKWALTNYLQGGGVGVWGCGSLRKGHDELLTRRRGRSVGVWLLGNGHMTNFCQGGGVGVWGYGSLGMGT